MTRRTIVVAAVLLLTAGLSSAEKRPFTVHDLVAMERVSDPQPSPDGSRVAYVVTTMDLEANKGRKDVWMVATDGTGARVLTTDPANDWNPRWRSDGALYFLSSRSGSTQVWRWNFASGAAEQVTDLPLAVVSLKVGPSGEALYVGIAVFPDCQDPIGCTAARFEERKAAKTSGMVFDQIFVRHWDTWKDGTRNHVFRVPIGEDGAGGAPVDLMAGVDGDCPTIPWGGDADYTISPDDAWLVYTAKVVNGSEEAWSTDFDLWAVPTDGSKTAQGLTDANPAWDSSPAFSPDGTTLAYLAMVRPGYEADRRRVMLMNWADRAVRTLTENWDLSPGDLAWTPDGSKLYASADNVGNHSIFTINPSDGMVSAVLTRHTNSNPRPLADGRLVFSQDSLVSPEEVYVLPSGDGEATPITHHNDERLAVHRLRRVQAVLLRRREPRRGLRLLHLSRRPRPVEEVPAGLPDPRRPAGQFRRPLALPLEPADLCGPRLCHGDDRFPRFDRLRPGFHRRHQRRLGRSAL